MSWPVASGSRSHTRCSCSARSSIDAVEAAVGRYDAAGQHLAQADELECRRATLRVTREGLLRDDVERVALAAADGRGETLVELGLVALVDARRRVVLGQHADVVGGQADLRQRLGQRRLASTTACRKRADAGRRDRRVDAVRERAGVRDDREHGQAHTSCDVTACQQDRAATLRLDESAVAAIVGAAEVAVLDALGLHGCRVGGGRHVGEADDAFDAQVVESAGDDELRLAELDLVDAFLDGDRRGGAGGDGVDHRAVASRRTTARRAPR